MDQLDGDRFNWTHYSYCTQYFLGYTPDPNGGVRTDDIPIIGSLGGMRVTERPNGLTKSQIESQRTMAIYNIGGIGHAVIIESHNSLSGKFSVYDPTQNLRYNIYVSDVSTCFEVDKVGTQYYWGGVGSGSY